MSEDPQSTAVKVQFIASHQPTLRTGNYEITLEQQIQIPEKSVTDSFRLKQDVQKFSVLGPRFTLDPQEIQAVFPPPGSLGDHSNVLPHLILQRSTLPWERSANGSKDIPWLALLLFDEGDVLHTDQDQNKILLDQIKLPNSWKFSELTAATVDLPKSSDVLPKMQYKVHFPIIQPESGDPPDDAVVNVIDIPKSFLKEILPNQDQAKPLDNKYLAHVRQTSDGAGKPQGEVAVLICNRLPKPGSMSIVHLVSLEDRYNDRGFAFPDGSDTDLIRLVSLHSWRFVCASEKHSFRGLLMHLNRQILFNISVDDSMRAALQKSPVPNEVTQKLSEAFHAAGQELFLPAQITEDPNGWILRDKINSYSMSLEEATLYIYRDAPNRSATLRLPDITAENLTIQKQVNQYLSMGCVPLAHTMRQGNQSISWYHGPLVPGHNSGAFDLPARSADELVQYNPANGMFDVSYAAAWELGRLLILQNKRVSVDLFNWKRSHTHSQYLEKAEEELAHLSLDFPSLNLELPETVKNWFRNMAHLHGIPFNYLVPDEAMLQTETIRFFEVDATWVDCLLDGAFSVGRVLTKDRARDGNLPKTDLPKPGQLLSGFLLRSDVVAGWPGLLVDGYADRYSGKEDIPDLEKSFSSSDQDFRIYLNAKQTTQLQNIFEQDRISLSSLCTIEICGWHISDPVLAREYDLLLSENEEIDIRLYSEAGSEFQFSLGDDFQPELNEGKISENLQRAFLKSSKQIILSPSSTISTTSWFITDQTNQRYYLVMNKGVNNDVTVYRKHKLPLLRMERLSKNVLFCLFEGILQTIDVHLKPETLHFGVTSNDNGATYFKDKVPVRWKNQDGKGTDKRVVDIVSLADDLQAKNSAEFARQMIEGVDKVRFVQAVS